MLVALAWPDRHVGVRVDEAGDDDGGSGVDVDRVRWRDVGRRAHVDHPARADQHAFAAAQPGARAVDDATPDHKGDAVRAIGTWCCHGTAFGFSSPIRDRSAADATLPIAARYDPATRW